MATAIVSEVAAERQWNVEEEEEEGAVGSELETKRGRGLRFSKKSTEIENCHVAAVAGVTVGSESRSVYFDEVQGTEFSSSDGAYSRLSETEHIVVEKNQENLNAEYTGILDDIQSISNAEEKQIEIERNIEVENDPDSQNGSVKKGEAEVAFTEPKTCPSELNGTIEVVKLDETEIDLEKVIEEQETHDLFCPNCHSCITRRVILRKRKRKVLDVPLAERPEKQRQLEPEVSAASATIAETGQVDVEKSQDNGPDVFRCLSCFSIFIPTENGFNIFGIFGKREERATIEVPNVQQPGQTAARNENWFYSIFKSDASWKTGSAAGASLLGGSQIASNSGFEGQDKQKSPVLASSETAGNIGIGNYEDIAAQVPIGIENSSLGDRTLEENENTPALPVSEPAKVVTSYASYGNINAAHLPPEFEVSSVNEYLTKDVCSSPALTLCEATHNREVHAKNKQKISEDDGIVPVITNKPALSSVNQSNPNVVGVMPIASVVLPNEEDIKPIPKFETPPGGSPQNIGVSAPPTAVLVPQGDVQIHVGCPAIVNGCQENQWEVLKSIIYGGLVESITSLGVVSSAAGAQTSTLKIVAIGIASLVGGFFLILNDLSELKNSAVANQKDEPSGRYWKLLGRRTNFKLHATVAIVSYILFGLLPPIIYGFSFRESDNKEYKLIAVAVASLLCISLLAVGKAHTSEPKSYMKTLLYYLGLCFTACGLSFVAGTMIDKFLEQFGLFEHDSPVLPPPSIQFLGASGLNSWAY